MRHLVAATTLSALVALGGLSGCVIAPPAVVGVDAEVQIAPPPLPLYVQPLAPGPGYLWTPGYWGWSAGGYYWIPGTWVLPPTVGLLWTPGWWGWAGGGYRWHAGYWGAQVGFYGGVDYGFGYFGVGYSGGQWRGNQFYYNTAISHVDVTHVTNVYVDKTVIVNNNVNRVSYNGGAGGLAAQPGAAERAAEGQRRVAPTQAQVHHGEVAMREAGQRWQAGHERPAVFATPHAARLDAPGAVRTPYEQRPGAGREMVRPEHAQAEERARAEQRARKHREEEPERR